MALATFISLPLSELFAAESKSSKFDQDRAAILGMVGEYEVKFHFEETLGFNNDYKLTKPYDEDAKELVVLVEDSPKRILLQHLLVVGESTVIKHWGQIWTFEDRLITQYKGQ